MSFPTTSILDSFNRANENPLSDGGKWTNAIGSNLQITSNQCVITTPPNDNLMYWNPNTFTNCEIFVTVNTILTVTNSYMLLGARFNIASINGYSLKYIRNTSGTDTLNLDKFVSGSPTNLTSYTQAISVGDSFGFSVNGSTISVYYKASGGSWTLLGTTTDTTYSSAGNLLLDIACANVAAGVINFGGGTIVTTKFRKTLSSIGTGTGKRQAQGWGQ